MPHRILPTAALNSSGRFISPQSSMPISPASSSSSFFVVDSSPDTPPSSDTASDRKPKPNDPRTSGSQKDGNRSRSGSFASEARGRVSEREKDGKGLGGFFRRGLSRGRQASQGSVEHPPLAVVPPVPNLPPTLLQLSFLDSEPSVPARKPESGFADATVTQNTTASSREPFKRGPSTKLQDASPAEDSELASLLHLVHAAGDLFSDTSSDPPPSSEPPALPFKSVSRPTADPTPKPYFSFLSHLEDGTRRDPPSQPASLRNPPPLSCYNRSPHLVTKKSQPIKADSDDEYGRDSIDSDPDDTRGAWNSRANASFRKAGGALPVVQTSHPLRGRGHFSGPTSPRTPPKPQSLGPKAKRLFEETHRKLLARDGQDGGMRPISTGAVGKRASGICVVLGRSMVDRKLRKGVTILEGREIEHRSEKSRPRTSSTGSQASSASSDASFGSAKSRSNALDVKKKSHDDPRKRLAPILITDALDPDVAVGRAGIQPTRPSADVWKSTSNSRPNQLPTLEGLDKWLSRPSFVVRKLVTVASQDGVRLNLVRERPKQPPIAFSPRIRRLGRHGLKDELPPTPVDLYDDVHRPSREARPSPSARPSKPSRPITSGTPHKKLVLPGPLLLQAIANGTTQAYGASQSVNSSEENLPLATLRSRGPSEATPPAADSSSSFEADSKATRHALKAAREKSLALQAEVSRLRTNEMIRKERQEQIDQDRYDRQRLQEIERREVEKEREVKRRQAEQRKRSRAAGQRNDTDQTPPTTPPANGKGRSTSSQSNCMDQGIMRRPISLQALKKVSTNQAAPPPLPQAYPTQTHWGHQTHQLAVPGSYMINPSQPSMGYFVAPQGSSPYGNPAFATSAPNVNPYFPHPAPLPMGFYGQHPSQMAFYPSPLPSPYGVPSPAPSPGATPPGFPPSNTPPRVVQRGGSSPAYVKRPSYPQLFDSADSSNNSSPRVLEHRKKSSPLELQSASDPFASRPMSATPRRKSSTPARFEESKDARASGQAFLSAAKASVLTPSRNRMEKRGSFVTFQ
ncbi:hypothetical protein P7C70_g5013, partial [Phenoliferia sp. Uapishka_3]